QLILAGGSAADDPESAQVLEKVMAKSEHDKDIHILLLPQDDIVVNALQRASDVIVQKSLKEGFGLTVAEALWKSKPVVASNVGGIPLQIKHKYSGLLCHSIDGASFAIKQFLANPEYAKKLGQNGKEHIRNNFLIARHIREYMLLFLSLYHKEDVVYL
ncbi:MAG: glycosyl transferase family 1, partial [Candidatus Omnitrophica bacterium CG_4_9_14_0_2_um_filter_42_8]